MTEIAWEGFLMLYFLEFYLCLFWFLRTHSHSKFYWISVYICIFRFLWNTLWWHKTFPCFSYTLIKTHWIIIIHCRIFLRKCNFLIFWWCGILHLYWTLWSCTPLNTHLYYILSRPKFRSFNISLYWSLYINSLWCLWLNAFK